jgi:hypothetical protein
MEKPMNHLKGPWTSVEEKEIPDAEGHSRPSASKRAYTAPRLMPFGAVRDLTQDPPPILDCSGPVFTGPDCTE